MSLPNPQRERDVNARVAWLQSNLDNGAHPGQVNTADSDAEGRRLLSLMSGAWATQAIRAAAELRIADHLDERGATAAELAATVGADEDSLSRLLLYLASLGILDRVDGRFTLSETGRLLRTDVSDSMHALALMYGGRCYDAFSALPHAVRTGENAFQHVFGMAPFDYLSNHPEDAEVFNRAMVAGCNFFRVVTDVLDFSDVEVVVDLGGGAGELLAQILAAKPSLRGVLVELPHVLEGARANLEQHGCLDRCELVGLDFHHSVPPEGDMYILSRILHDWSSDTCHRILTNCRSAMRGDETLVIIERLIPDDDSPSLARSWDIHMMVNNIGGRERTYLEYQELLAHAGLTVRERRPLPLELEALIVQPTSPT